MSFIKTIGNKLKRVVSLKNAVSLVTGNYGAVTADIKRVMTTPDKKQPNNPAANVVLPSFEIPPLIDSALKQQVENLSAKTANTLASSKLVQDNVNPVNGFFTKVWFKATWEKNKVLIIALCVAIFGFVGWKLFKKPKRATR